jgi:hypothetical protein
VGQLTEANVVLNTGACVGVTVPVSVSAAEAVRMAFNPSGLESVNRLKSLAAAFISECERLKSEDPAAGRELAVAITNMQTASMWGVLGATRGH